MIEIKLYKQKTYWVAETTINGKLYKVITNNGATYKLITKLKKYGIANQSVILYHQDIETPYQFKSLYKISNTINNVDLLEDGGDSCPATE